MNKKKTIQCKYWAKKTTVLRKLLGMSSTELGKEIDNVSGDTILKWEKGQRNPKGKRKKIIATKCKEVGLKINPLHP